MPTDVSVSALTFSLYVFCGMSVYYIMFQAFKGNSESRSTDINVCCCRCRDCYVYSSPSVPTFTRLQMCCLVCYLLTFSSCSL